MDAATILEFLQQQKPFLASQFGMTGLFGSFAKGTQRADSDVDMESVKYRQILLKDLWAAKFGRKIHLTCKGKHLRLGFINIVESYIHYA